MLFVCLPFLFFFLFLINVFNNNLWHCLSELSDLSLRSLASRLESSVVASRAPGTTEAYRRAFLWWKEFATSKTEICAFPANLEHVALYLQHTVSSHMIRKLVEKSNLDNLIESLNVCVLFWFIGWFLPN